MIKLIDLIELAGVKLGDYKIHCATGVKSPPLQAFFDGVFKRWQEEQNQKNFQCQQIISLIYLTNAQWLFAGMYEVLGCRVRKGFTKIRYLYATREIPGLDHLVGRVIVRFDKKFRASYLRGPKHADNVLVDSIRDQRLSIEDFPGYKKVRLPLGMLRTIVREEQPTWRAALSSVAGVYLVNDTSSGKLYVGSAYGMGGFWQRWTVYASNGHGNNKELRDLLRVKGDEHALHFQFSLLEVCDLDASKDDVLNRESHWKDVLCSREFGLN